MLGLLASTSQLQQPTTDSTDPGRVSTTHVTWGPSRDPSISTLSVASEKYTHFFLRFPCRRAPRFPSERVFYALHRVNSPRNSVRAPTLLRVHSLIAAHHRVRRREYSLRAKFRRQRRDTSSVVADQPAYSSLLLSFVDTASCSLTNRRRLRRTFASVRPYAVSSTPRQTFTREFIRTPFDLRHVSLQCRAVDVTPFSEIALEARLRAGALVRTLCSGILLGLLRRVGFSVSALLLASQPVERVEPVFLSFAASPVIFFGFLFGGIQSGAPPFTGT